MLERRFDTSARGWLGRAAAVLGSSRPSLARYLQLEEQGESGRIPASLWAALDNLPDLQATKPFTPLPTTADVVHHYAAGLVDLQQHMDETGHIQAPYPVSLHDGFDMAAALNIVTAGARFPVSLADLLRVADRPLYEWCPDYARVGPPEFVDAQLMSEGQVTSACLALGARSQSDPEEPLYDKLMEICDAIGEAEAEDFYRAWRKCVVEKPFAWSRAELLDSDPLFLVHSRRVSELIDAFYVTVPVAALRDQIVRLCPITRTRVFRSNGKWCSEFRDPRAARALANQGPVEHPAVEGMLELRRAARTFWTLPGRHELELATRVQERGLNVVLWPKLDAADLLIESGDGAKRWVVDVKDYLSPRSLARAFSGFNGFRRARRALVIPDYLNDRTPQYREIFDRARRANLANKVELLTASQLLRELEA